MTLAIEQRRYSQRRACRLVGVDRKTYRYVATRGGDEGIRHCLEEPAAQRRGFGYRRLHILRRWEGIVVNHKKLFRLYCEERLTVRRRGGRKRALGTRAPLALPDKRNQLWSLDFVADALMDSRRFSIPAVVDDYTHACLALVVDTSRSGTRVVRELDRIAEARGYPRQVVSDNGTELTSHAILRWREERSMPGTPSRPASRSRTASPRASSATCAMSASMSICSRA